MKSSIPTELEEIERLLAELTPAALSEQSVDRLVGEIANVTGDLQGQVLDEQMLGFDDLERQLDELAPETMRVDVLSRMVEAMDTWHEKVPEEEKVISFGENQPLGQSQPSPRGGLRRHRGMVAAAAAVAVLGGISAFMLPSSPEPAKASQVAAQVASFLNQSDVSQGLTKSPEVAKVARSDSRDAWLVPDAASQKVVSTSERGLVMTPDNMAHRCIQLDGMETIKLEDESGRKILIERPHINYLLIPVEAH